MTKGKLTPEQIARFQDKMQSGGPGTVVNDSGPRYYRMGGENVAGVLNHEYSYLDHDNGKWVPDPAVCDAVTGYRGDASTVELTEKQARSLIAKLIGKAGRRAGKSPGIA